MLEITNVVDTMGGERERERERRDVYHFSHQFNMTSLHHTNANVGNFISRERLPEYILFKAQHSSRARVRKKFLPIRKENIETL